MMNSALYRQSVSGKKNEVELVNADKSIVEAKLVLGKEKKEKKHKC